MAGRRRPAARRAGRRPGRAPVGDDVAPGVDRARAARRAAGGRPVRRRAARAAGRAERAAEGGRRGPARPGDAGRAGRRPAPSPACSRRSPRCSPAPRTTSPRSARAAPGCRTRAARRSRSPWPPPARLRRPAPTAAPGSTCAPAPAARRRCSRPCWRPPAPAAAPAAWSPSRSPSTAPTWCARRCGRCPARTRSASPTAGTPREPGRYDRVLVDAPCTGLGALRRRPEARWRRSPAGPRDARPAAARPAASPALDAGAARRRRRLRDLLAAPGRDVGGGGGRASAAGTTSSRSTPARRWSAALGEGRAHDLGDGPARPALAARARHGRDVPGAAPQDGLKDALTSRAWPPPTRQPTRRWTTSGTPRRTAAGGSSAGSPWPHSRCSWRSGWPAFFGVRTATVSASSGGYELTVEYPRVARAGLDALWRVTVRREGGFDGPITLTTSGGLLRHLRAPGLLPGTGRGDRRRRPRHPDVQPADRVTPSSSPSTRTSSPRASAAGRRRPPCSRTVQDVVSVRYRTWIAP